MPMQAVILSLVCRAGTSMISPDRLKSFCMQSVFTLMVSFVVLVPSTIFLFKSSQVAYDDTAFFAFWGYGLVPYFVIGVGYMLRPAISTAGTEEPFRE